MSSGEISKWPQVNNNWSVGKGEHNRKNTSLFEVISSVWQCHCDTVSHTRYRTSLSMTNLSNYKTKTKIVCESLLGEFSLIIQLIPHS